MTTVGLALPHYDRAFPATETAGRDRTRQAIDHACAAERAGLHAVWVSDHFWVDAGDGIRLRSPDCWTLLAAIAACTERIRLGSLVTSAPLRSPEVLAHQIATVIDIAGDRVDVGLGAGWQEEEFRAHGIPFPDAGVRLAAVADSASAIRRRLGPDAPPIWIGGKRPGALRMAGSVADGWNLAWNPSPEDYVRRRRIVDSAAVAAGRRPSDVRWSVGLVGLLGEDEGDLRRRWAQLRSWVPGGHLDGVSLAAWRRRGLVGPLTEVADRLAAWTALGVEHVVCGLGMPFGLCDDGQLDLLGRAAALRVPRPPGRADR